MGYPLGFIITEVNVSDFDQAKPLLKPHLQVGSHAIMDKGYDSDAIRAYVNQLGGVAVIALHPSRSPKPTFDEHLYHERHRIENLFARLKHYRRIAPVTKTPRHLRRHALSRPHPGLAQTLSLILKTAPRRRLQNEATMRHGERRGARQVPPTIGYQSGRRGSWWKRA